MITAWVQLRMVRRSSNKFKQTKTPVIIEINDEQDQNGTDPWTTIENGEAVTAREVFYKKPTPEEPRVKHYEKFKNKKQRISDGLGAERVEIHSRAPKGTKRRITINSVETTSDSPTQKQPLKRVKLNNSDGDVNVFAEVLKTKSANGNKTKKAKKQAFATGDGDVNGKFIDLFVGNM
ncbi:hypothetical protein ANCDUO_16783, partial [Ancylostoma duodenale]